MQNVTISEGTLSQLNQAAMLRGMDSNTYADELLAISLAVLRETVVPQKPHRAMEFSAIETTGRTAAEIDAEIEVGRGEWPEAFPKAAHP